MRWLLCLVVILCSVGLPASTSVEGQGKGGDLPRAGGAGWRRRSGRENGLHAGRIVVNTVERWPPSPPLRAPPPPLPPPPPCPPPPFPPLPPRWPPPSPRPFSPPPPSPPPPSPPPPPKVAVLSGLEISSGTLTPSFSEFTFNYTASVEYSVSEIQLTVYVPEEEIYAGYELDIDGTGVESGSTSSNQELGSYGETIEIVISLSVYGYSKSAYLLYVSRGSKSGLATVYIVLIVVACVVVFALILLAIYCCCIRGLCPVNWVPEACIPARFRKRDDYQEVPQTD